ncbi:MAG: Zn-dependent oligopeptidase [Proteobacteria bacterium]|nr:Zn-dependent oligopeptidase [Pseudomonadota bacterium]
MTNPLLTPTDLPSYAAIQPEHVEPAIDHRLAENRADLERLLAVNAVYSWDNLIRPLEDLEDRLNKAWSPVNHLHSVCDSEALRAAYNACLPKLSAYYSELGQHPGLYRAYQQIADGPEYARFDPAQRKVITDALRDFRLSGIALPPDQQARYRDIQQELAQLGAKFSENVLDATQAWTKHLTDEAQLAGLPDSARALARQTAQQRGLDGWLLTLELPSYLPVLSYADDRELRRELYSAYCTRASEQGPNGGQWDNGPVMERILALRHELARLLGFHDYTEYSLATKMADSPDQVLDFLADLARRARPQAQRELDELRTFAREQFGADDLQVWDIGYYAEKLRQHRYQLSQEELRPYFPLPRVLTGLFAVAERLFAIAIRPLDSVEVWHPDVRVYEIVDAAGTRRGRFYLDGYARPHKRGGAWMDGCLARRRLAEAVRSPAAYLVGNFTPPVGDDPGLSASGGHSRGGMGCRGTAQPVHGELVLGEGGARPAGRPLPNRRTAAGRTLSTDAGGQALPGRDFDGAATGIWAVRLSAAPRLRPGARRAGAGDTGRSTPTGGGHPPAGLEPFCQRLHPHLRRRLRGGLLQLQMGGSTIGGRLQRLRGQRDFQRCDRRAVPGKHPGSGRFAPGAGQLRRLPGPGAAN